METKDTDIKKKASVERQIEKDKDRKTKTERQREKDKQRKTKRERQRQKDKGRWTNTKNEKERQTRNEFLSGRYNVEMLTETDSNRKMAIV